MSPRVAGVPPEQIAGAIPDEADGGRRVRRWRARWAADRLRAAAGQGPVLACFPHWASRGADRAAARTQRRREPGRWIAISVPAARSGGGRAETRRHPAGDHSDGPLHRLPFDALRLADGRLAVERFASRWRRPPESYGSCGDGAVGLGGGRQVRVLALGDPRFERENQRGRRGRGVRRGVRGGGWASRLPASAAEARLVGRYGDSAEVRLRDDASEAYLKRAPLGEFRVLHFATHAVVDDRSVARTAIALTPGAQEDGFLSPAELAAFALHADLVVLSACRTAGGVLVAGEGVQGLTAPLLQAGARSVVATRWRIADRAAVRMIQPFYDALAAAFRSATRCAPPSSRPCTAARRPRVGLVHGGRRPAGSDPAPPPASSVARLGRRPDRGRHTVRHPHLCRGRSANSPTP